MRKLTAHVWFAACMPLVTMVAALFFRYKERLVWDWLLPVLCVLLVAAFLVRTVLYRVALDQIADAELVGLTP